MIQLIKKQYLLKFMVALTIALFLPSACGSQKEAVNSYWQPVTSPDRARVAALAYYEGTLLAGTSAGLFASDDLADRWRLQSSANMAISSLLITEEGSLLAGTYRQGIFRSTNKGQTWTPVGFDRNVYIALNMDHEGKIYAASRGSVENEPTGVFSSDDDGLTWTASGLGEEDVYSLSFPRPGIIFAGTPKGLFRSEDGGKSWTATGELPSKAPVSKVVEYNNFLFASMGAPLMRIPGGGVARSADEGKNWEPTKGLPPETAVHDLAIHAGVLYAGTGNFVHGGGKGLYSYNKNEIWHPSGLDDAWLLSLLETPKGLFVGAYELGVFHSVEGKSWVRRSSGLRNWTASPLGLDSKKVLYALSVRSLLRSNDQGETWTELPRPEHSAAPTPWSLIITPDEKLILAGEGGVLFSKDKGESWEHRDIPGENDQVFALTSGPGAELFAVVPGKAGYHSKDEGLSWKEIKLPGEPTQALFLTPDGTRFITTAAGFWRWSEGESWQPVGKEQVWNLLSCGDALIAGTYSKGLLRSTDDGLTWAPVTEDLRAKSQQKGYMTFTALACLPGGDLLAGTFWDGVFYSFDGGMTWKDVSAGLPAPTALGMAVDKTGKVFLSTPAGIYTGSFINNR